MNNRDAFKRACKAVSRAVNAIDPETQNTIIQDLASGDADSMIGEALAYEFKQGPKPDWWESSVESE